MQLTISRTPLCKLPVSGDGKPRISVISAGYRFSTAATFAPSKWVQLEKFGPNVLVGSTADLQRLVERLDLKTLKLTSIDRAIYVVTEIGDKPLNDVLRVVLWQRFGVPVFELFWSHREGLLAYECEAHEGWHIVEPARFAVYRGELVWYAQASETVLRTGLQRIIEGQPCGCGRGGNRIIDVEQQSGASESEPLAATA